MNTDREPHVRKLTLADIGSALELSSEAGWNQTARDWQLLVDLEPDGCFAIEVDGEIVSTATLITYGQKLAWIGMVLTRIRHRGRGFAKQLMNQALELADKRGIESVKLDATDQGRPLYEKLGFHAEQPVERWAGERLTVPGDWISASMGALKSSSLSLDEAAFGMNRSRLLQKLSVLHHPSVAGDSFAFSRPGRVSHYFGPCVAETERDARTLVNSLSAPKFGQGYYWDLFPANRYAISLAQEFGFTPRRQLTRMVRGKELRGNDELTYALAGFEFG